MTTIEISQTVYQGGLGPRMVLKYKFLTTPHDVIQVESDICCSLVLPTALVSLSLLSIYQSTKFLELKVQGTTHVTLSFATFSQFSQQQTWNNTSSVDNLSPV